jgi:hypothetical protein
MKISRIWWPVCFLLLVVSACSKDQSNEGDGGNNGAFYIRCKIDGTAKTFNVTANASKQDLGAGTFSYSIFGKAAQDATNFESFGFTLQIGSELSAGTYTETDSTAGYYLVAVYNPNSTDPSMFYPSAKDSIDPFQITVSEITDSLMTGTFKGKLYQNTTDATPPSVSVTEGEFKLRIQ